jgi:Zn finger protein HypA/HybF involved in hydrogenase expression
MPLPILEAAKYQLKIPSTKKVIEFRPFLVKEEKLLMIAQESQDEAQIFSTLKEIIRVCTFEKMDVESLTTYDLEFIFIRLRSKSVGESSEIKIKCDECGKFGEHVINLDDIDIVYPKEEVSSKIPITKDIGMILKPISIGDASSVKDNDITSSIIASIESIYDEESVYTKDSVSHEELVQFVDSLTHKTLEEVKNYLEAQPRVEHQIEYQCPHCGKKSIKTLSGIQSFF